MGEKEYKNQSAYKTKIAAFRSYMVSFASLFADGSEADPKEVHARMEEIFEFESKLALVSYGFVLSYVENFCSVVAKLYVDKMWTVS